MVFDVFDDVDVDDEKKKNSSRGGWMMMLVNETCSWTCMPNWY
jgi:hypothetical protein